MVQLSSRGGSQFETLELENQKSNFRGLSHTGFYRPYTLKITFHGLNRTASNGLILFRQKYLEVR